jgi:hypothetical protein
MAKTEQTQEQSVIITPGQARAVSALQFERNEIVRQANEQIAQINEAFQEQGRILALVHELPRGDDWQYRFEDVDVDGQLRVKLSSLPKEQEPETPPVEDPPPAEAEEQAEADQGQGDGD